MKLWNCISMLAAIFALVASSAAYAGSHAYINKTRSSTAPTYYLMVDYAPEQSKFVASGHFDSENPDVSSVENQTWQGYSFRTGIAAELWNIIQLGAAHRLLEKDNRDADRELMKGWGLDVVAKLVFKSPIVNIEFGTGILGSRLDYFNGLEFGRYHGSGLFNSIDLNHYWSRRVSLYAHIRQETEHLVKTGGNASMETIDTNTTHIGLGFRIWMSSSPITSVRRAL